MATVIVPPAGLTWATVDSGVSIGSKSKSVLTDGYVFYCAHCDYTNKTYSSVRGHAGKHSGRRLRGAGRGPGRRTVEVADRNIESALSLISEAVDEIRKTLSNQNRPLVTAKQLEVVAAQRDAAVARARAAEKKMETLQSTFRSMLS